MWFDSMVNDCKGYTEVGWSTWMNNDFHHSNNKPNCTQTWVPDLHNYWGTPIVIPLIPLTVLHLAIREPTRKFSLKGNQILNEEHINPYKRREKSKENKNKK